MYPNFQKIFDQLKICIYMTDPETYQIIFMNQKMKELYNISDVEGKICWQVLQNNQNGPCSFCKVPELLQSKDLRKMIYWQERSNKIQCIFDNYDSLIEWDGKLLHLQQSYDITQMLHLNECATKDALCDVWNRAHGKKMLSDCLAQLHHSHTCLVALLDVDNLKGVNDSYGHAEGDFLLKEISGVLKKYIHEPNFIFRLSGDEFVVVLLDTDEEAGNALLQQARKEVGELREQHGKEYHFSFSYGLSLANAETIYTSNEILAQADEKMYIAKLCRFKDDFIQENKNLPPLHTPLDVTMEYPSELLYDALIRCTDDFIYLCNMKTGVFWYSSKQVEMFDLPGEIIANPLPHWKKIVHPDDWDRFYKSNMELGINHQDSHLVEFRAKNRNGEYVWLKCRGQLIRDKYGEPSLFAGIMALLGKQNKIDPLTQLLNHQEFLKAIKHCKQEDQMVVAVLDVDNFRQINGVYSRSFGDEVLKTVAQTMQAILPDNTTLYRLDSDRFGLLIHHADIKDAETIYKLLQEQLLRMQVWKQYQLDIEISAGCAIYPLHSSTGEDLYRYADYALQYAKNHGRNRLVIFNEEILRNKISSIDLFKKLQDAISHDYRGFSLNYQPQVNGKNRKITGVEVLIRWNDKDGKPVPPSDFIPIMEENGMIYEMGLWIIRTALQSGKKWLQSHPDFSLSINVSALQIIEKDFIPDLCQIVEAEQFPYQNLIIELTESHTVQNIELFRDSFNRLRALGIRIAMDDFGTGYSSLEILKHAPVDIVKIDRGFVKNVLNSSFDATLISFMVTICMVTICHDVNIKVCVEGVEKAEEYELLKNMNPDSIQGYYFGRPINDAQITELLEEE